MSDLRKYADRLSPEDREAMMATGFACSERELPPHEPRPRKERAPKAAGPHAYRSVRIYTQDGLIVRCNKYDACQDERHRVMAALGVLR